MSYDAFAITFSSSRRNLHWPELDSIIADIKKQQYSRVMDIGCGNGRFLEAAGEANLIVSRYLGIDSSE